VGMSVEDACGGLVEPATRLGEGDEGLVPDSALSVKRIRVPVRQVAGQDPRLRKVLEDAEEDLLWQVIKTTWGKELDEASN